MASPTYWMTVYVYRIPLSPCTHDTLYVFVDVPDASKQNTTEGNRTALLHAAILLLNWFRVSVRYRYTDDIFAVQLLFCTAYIVFGNVRRGWRRGVISQVWFAFEPVIVCVRRSGSGGAGIARPGGVPRKRLAGWWDPVMRTVRCWTTAIRRAFSRGARPLHAPYAEGRAVLARIDNSKAAVGMHSLRSVVYWPPGDHVAGGCRPPVAVFEWVAWASRVACPAFFVASNIRTSADYRRRFNK